MQLFPMLKSLGTIRIQELNVATLFVLDLIRETSRPVHLIVEYHAFGNDQEKYLSLAPSSQLSFGVGIGMHTSDWGIIKPILLESPHIKALQFRHWPNDSIRVAVPPSHLDYDGLLNSDGVPLLKGRLEELHMNDVMLHEDAFDIGIPSILKAIDWSCIRRLALKGRGLVEDFFPRVAGRLLALECLQLSSPNPQSYLLACGLVGSGYDNSVPFKTNLSPEASPFRALPKLRELGLDGASNALPLDCFANASLKKLTLHLQETSATVRTQGTLSAEKLRRCALLMPSISHLEVDIGQLHNLWHPNAIPGVDVDVHLYPVLDALTTFPNLRFLRLFPPYIVRGSQRNREPSYHHPVSDKQAIEIFRHLRRRRPSLQVLAIFADGAVAKEASWFYAPSWEVSMLGEKILLKTRQAKMSYEQVQVWEGERRLTTRSKSLAYPRPYLPDPEGWILPLNS
jgi:hypothetical protein